MLKSIFSILAVMIPFFWLGALTAISFMESWLKFQAPGMTLSLGLGVGKLVFSALNKLEWVCAGLLIISIWMQKWSSLQYTFFTIILLSLFIQTFFLFPVLLHRIAVIQQQGSLPQSYIHMLYIVLEFIKAICLIALGVLMVLKNKTD